MVSTGQLTLQPYNRFYSNNRTTKPSHPLHPFLSDAAAVAVSVSVQQLRVFHRPRSLDFDQVRLLTSSEFRLPFLTRSSLTSNKKAAVGQKMPGGGFSRGGGAERGRKRPLHGGRGGGPVVSWWRTLFWMTNFTIVRLKRFKALPQRPRPKFKSRVLRTTTTLYI